MNTLNTSITDRKPVRTALTQYLNSIGKIPRITPEEEQSLAQRCQNGCEISKTRLVEANLRFVVSLATAYQWSGELLEIISAGNTGLIEAASRFKPGKGAKFSTYAAHWIRRKIQTHVSNSMYGSAMKVPPHMCAKIAKLKDARAKNPNIAHEELREATGFSDRVIKYATRACVSTINLDYVTADHATLHSDDDSGSSSEMGFHAKHPSSELDSDLCMELLNKSFAKLNPRLQLILKMRFGLQGAEPQTLEEIGKHFNLTRERVRQLQKTALKTLRKRIHTLDVSSSARKKWFTET